MEDVLFQVYYSAMDDTDPLRVSKAMEIYNNASLTIEEKIDQIVALLKR